MEISVLFSFLAAAIALSFMPGSDNLYVFTESVTKGPRKGLYVVLGLMTGVLVHTTLAATGLALVLRQNQDLFKAVSWAGALYLLYLAWQAYREKPQLMQIKAAGTIQQKPNFWASYRKGFFMNVLNPKVTLFFLAFLPQFVRPEGGPALQQFLFLGLLFILQGSVVFGSIALLAGQARQLIKNPVFWRVTYWLKIFILLALALFLLLD